MLEQPAPVRDEAARLALAEAVAAHRAAQADHAATVAAAAAAEQAVYDARGRVDAAEEAAAQAPQDAADHQAAVARGTAGPAPATARERRGALLDAEDALTAARSARDLLRQRVTRDAERVALAERRSREAALAVMKFECAPAAAELLDALARAQEATARLGAIAESLVMAGVIEATGPVKLAVGRHASPPSAWGWQGGLPGTGPDAEWRAALAVLMTDANAPADVGLRA